MFVDGRELPEGFTDPREYDLCIVGAGAAGISLALEFLNTGLSVCILETGGFEIDPQYLELCRGEVDGPGISPDYLVKTRLRVFGGSTMAWGGLCRPFDESDFLPRPWLPDFPGWPFPRSVLVPYYERAAKVLEIPGFFGPHAPRKSFGGKQTSLEALTFRFSPPTYMGAAYRSDFAAAPNAVVYLHTTATELSADPNGRRIATLRAVAPTRRTFLFKAQRFVLAAGGIETPRILLNSDRLLPLGIGNQNDLVGRFFMSHFPVNGIGRALFAGETAQRLFESLHKETVQYLALQESILSKHKLLNAACLLHSSLPPGFEGRLGNRMLAAFPATQAFFQERTLSFQPVPMMLVLEHAPNRESRILLTKDRDFIGMRKARLSFRRAAADENTLMKTLELLGREFGKASLGRIQADFSSQAAQRLLPDDHHMGSTRMHQRPDKGVVDPNCKVHGVENLYIAGPSVFPSGSFANPMLTIVAMSLRLADHLKMT